MTCRRLLHSHRFAAIALLTAGCLLGMDRAPAAAAPTTILVLGDSLSSGYGLALGEGWVDLLGRRLKPDFPGYRIVNASISGDTTKGGASRIGGALREHRPRLVIVELGGNDGLRGIRVEASRDNLRSIIRQCRNAGAAVVLLGMQLPPNYGPRYTTRFAGMYPELSRELGASLVPSFLAGVGDRMDLMQADGIHPTAHAQPMLLDNVWPHLRPLLE